MARSGVSRRNQHVDELQSILTEETLTAATPDDSSSLAAPARHLV